MRDPYEVIRPFTPEKEEDKPKLDPKLSAWYSESYGKGRGHTIGKAGKGFTEICRYVNGRHACGEICPKKNPTIYKWDTGNSPIEFRGRLG